MSVVIVTGGARGIGKAISKKLAENGNKVMINYNNSYKQANELKKELKDKGYSVDIFKADVSKREEARKLIEYTRRGIWRY